MHISLSKLWELVINSEPLGAAVDVLQRVCYEWTTEQKENNTFQ